jgi:primosomal protein N' (replication factor Y)
LPTRRPALCYYTAVADEKYADVHFTRPPFGPFTYAVDGEAPPSPGCRLEVELGKRAAVGLAGRPAPRPSPSVKVKKITRIIDYEPVFPPFIWELLEYVSRRYATSPGEAARLALPVPLDLKRDDILVLAAEFAASPALEGLGEEERRLAGEVWEAGWLGAKAAGLSDAVRGLQNKNVIAVEPYATRPALDDLLVFAAATSGKRLGKVGQALVAALAEGPQPAKRYLLETKARDALRRLLRSRQVALGLVSNGPPVGAPPRAGATLVTGGDAGRRLEEALAAARDAGAKDVLVLVPEMYRVPAVRRRCEDFWGNSFESYYSEMSPGARWRVFSRCRRRTVTRVVGSRSALFLPLAPEAAVVITDEADGAYKQWEMPPYYHARDVGAARAAGTALVMAAAAPSLEAYACVSSGDAALRPVPEGGRKPELTIVDMAKVVATEGPVILSAALVRGLQETLAAGKRALVVVNRRGYIPHIYCGACGRSLTCGRCDVAFTYHKEESVLRCHYCMRREPMPRRCPYCGKEKLTGVGFGTEKLAAEVELVFADARVGRADSDALPTPARARSFWEDVAAGVYGVVVGTQMALRALDHEEVALAALANADTAMNLPDFRASEQTFRTVRRMLEPSSRRRRVLIQTFHPDHYAVAAAAAGDYDAFAKQELAFRRRLELPPFTHLVNVVVAEREKGGGERKASEIATRLEDIFGPRADILGPVPAPVARSRGRRRWQILIKTDLREIENAADELAALASRKGPARIRVDVDPYELF